MNPASIFDIGLWESVKPEVEIKHDLTTKPLMFATKYKQKAVIYGKERGDDWKIEINLEGVPTFALQQCGGEIQILIAKR